MFFQVPSEILNVSSDVLFWIGDFGFTNSMTSGLLVTITLITITILLGRKITYTETPGKFQLILEMFVNFMLGFIEQIAGNRKIAEKILPLVGGLFLYLALANTMLTFIPGIAAIQYNGVSIFRVHTSDFNATFGVAIAMIIFTHLVSIQQYNVFVHINKYFKIGDVIKSFKQGIGTGLLSLIDFLLIGPLDIISEFAKSFSLSLRLFGNVFAGEILGGVMMGLFALAVPIPIMLLSLFSGFIQALVFGALTASYFGIALKEE